jgi:hypothetical protein
MSFVPPNPNAPIKVTITVDPFPVQRMMERVMKVLAGGNLEAFLKGPAHEYLEHDIVQRFAYEGDKKSGDWAPLSDATQRIRQSLGYSPDDINIRQNEMFDVLTHEADYYSGPFEAEMSLPGSAGQRGRMKDKMETATKGRANNPIAGFGPTPPRPVLSVDASDMEVLLTMLNGWIIAELAGSFP